MLLGALASSIYDTAQETELLLLGNCEVSTVYPGPPHYECCAVRPAIAVAW